MKNVTGDQVKAAMIGADITYVEHHNCGGCGYMTNYSRIGDDLFFDRGCNCGSYGGGPESRSWASAADWINMQSIPKNHNDLRTKFGLPTVD